MIPRYRQVADELIRDLSRGKYKPGQKLPSEAALVQRFRTSRITVGRALRELKTRGLIRGVAGSGNFVKQEAVSASQVFGLLIPNLGETEIFEQICRGIASAPEQLALLWGNSRGSDHDLEGEAIQLCRQFIDRGVSGVFFAPLEFTPRKDAVNAEICSMIDAAKIPMVLLDRNIEMYPKRIRYDLVGIDNRRAGYLAAAHLIDRGCQEIAFLALSDAAPTVKARMAGFRDALGSLPGRIAICQDLSPGSLMSSWKAMVSSAVVCANDRIAAELMRVLLASGIRIPDRVRLVGIDDADYARLLPVPLTTVHQPCRELGRAAAAAMAERLRHPEMPAREILLECFLTVRESSQ